MEIEVTMAPQMKSMNACATYTVTYTVSQL
jgi:hypothetical protein